jgi:hypothetical protein
MDVRFEDGCVEIYWFHELRRVVGQRLPWNARTMVARARWRRDGSYEENDGRLKLLQANEARRGAAVRVRDGHRRRQFAGMHGTVRHLWGPSEHAAVDVLLEDGRSELFWLSDLSVVDEDIAAV